MIPVTFDGRSGGYTHCMFLNDHPPIAGGRELWGFPKKLADPRLTAHVDALVGRLEYHGVPCGAGHHGLQAQGTADRAAVLASLHAPNFLLKIIPHVDGSPRICEIVEYELTDIDLKGAWTGPAALTLVSHALAPLAELPVLEVLSGHPHPRGSDPGAGAVVYDYLQE